METAFKNGTEKLAYPCSLKNKTHLEDLCMPCCNANQKILEEGRSQPDYDRCLQIHRINAYYEIEGDRNLTNLKNELKLGLEFQI